MNPMTTVTTTKNLANSSCIGNRATPPLMLRIGGVQHQLQHRRQDRQLQLHVGRDPAVDVAPEVDGVHQGGEVVVGEDELAGLLGDLRAAAHGDADVGLLQRGGVVDGVAGHRHDLTGLLHQPGEADLVLGGDPAEDVQLGQLLDHLRRR